MPRWPHALVSLHAVGEGATELLAVVAVAYALQGKPYEIARTMHAHPTLSELMREAALATNGEAIHYFQPPSGAPHGSR